MQARVNRILGVAAASLLVVTAIAATRSAPIVANSHVVNPYAGAAGYVDPSYAYQVERSAKAMDASNPQLAAAMRVVEQQSTAVWLPSIASIAGPASPQPANGYSLKGHLDNAVAQMNSNGGTPVVITLVIYDAPGRDCGATASAGELTTDGFGFTRYMTQYIDPIAALLNDSKYADLRIALVIEPDGLPNMVTNLVSQNWIAPQTVINCNAAHNWVDGAVIYSLGKFHPIVNAYTFLDIANSTWLGWSSNQDLAATYYANLITGSKASGALPDGFNSVDGFSSNVSNFVPTTEPFFTASKPVDATSATFYDSNATVDELGYATAELAKLKAKGFTANTGWIMDTGRNGWGGPNRPTKASTSTSVNTFIDQSRIDRRTTRAAYCNPDGAGIGALPSATPSGSPGIWANVWVKPPGQSDGGATSGIAGYDSNCDPSKTVSMKTQLTGALPNAPRAGTWFPQQFQQLVANAYPALNGYSPATNGPPSTATPAAGASCIVNGAPKVSATGVWYPDARWVNTTALGQQYTGFQATVTVVNNGTVPTTGWKVTWVWKTGSGWDSVATFQSFWNGNESLGSDGNTETVTNMSYNGVIQPGQSTTFGFVANVSNGIVPSPKLTCTAS